MNMLNYAIALFIAILCGITPVATKAVTIEVVKGFEYTNTSGPALLAEIEADGLTIDGSAANVRSVTGFFGTPPSQGTRSFQMGIDVAEDINGGSVGLVGTAAVFAGDKFLVDFIPRRRESFGLINPHVDTYRLFGILFNGDGHAISDPMILAEGTSVVANNLEYQTGSAIMPGKGILGFGFYIFHEEGIAVAGRGFLLDIDNVRIERAPPVVVPVPPAVLLFAGALASIIRVRRRKV